MTEVAKVSIGIEGDTSKLKADVAKATNEVNAAGAASADKATEATNRQAAATSALGDRLKAVKKTYGEQIEVVQGLIGKIAAIGGIATIAFTVGKAIREYIVTALEDGAERAKDFSANLNFNDPAKAAEALSAEIQRVEGELAATKEQYDNVKDAGFGGVAELIAGQRKQAQLEEQLRDLRIKRGINEKAAEAKATKDAAEKKAETEKKAAEKAASDVASITEQARLDSMTEEQRIVAEAEAKIATLVKAFNAQTKEERIASDESTAEAIISIRRKAQEEVEKRRQDAEADAARKKEDERRKEEEWWDKLRKHQEEQDQRAKQTRESWSATFRAIREESNRAFATDQAASMVQLAGQLRIEGMTAAANMNQIVVQGVG